MLNRSKLQTGFVSSIRFWNTIVCRHRVEWHKGGGGAHCYDLLNLDLYACNSSKIILEKLPCIKGHENTLSMTSCIEIVKLSSRTYRLLVLDSWSHTESSLYNLN